MIAYAPNAKGSAVGLLKFDDEFQATLSTVR